MLLQAKDMAKRGWCAQSDHSGATVEFGRGSECSRWREKGEGNRCCRRQIVSVVD
jgi:hypothetical protein